MFCMAAIGFAFMNAHMCACMRACAHLSLCAQTLYSICGVQVVFLC